MPIICAWCDKLIGTAEACERPGASHGMCTSCLAGKLAALGARPAVDAQPRSVSAGPG